MKSLHDKNNFNACAMDCKDKSRWEPEVVRHAMYQHEEVEQILPPWHGMFERGNSEQSSFKNSYVLQQVPVKAGAGESEET